MAKEADMSADNLMISGTHIHSAPGNYLDSEFYNKFTSNDSGLDRGFFDFRSRKIADAVIQAYQSSRPAKIATGRIEVWGADPEPQYRSIPCKQGGPEGYQQVPRHKSESLYDAHRLPG
jgi:neutral ceramidase